MSQILNTRLLAVKCMMAMIALPRISFTEAVKQLGPEQMAEISRRSDSWAIAAISVAKIRPDCSHEDDEAVAGLLIAEMESGDIRRDDRTN